MRKLEEEVREMYQRGHENGCAQIEELTRLRTNEQHILDSLEEIKTSQSRVADALEKLARQDERVSRLESDVDTLYNRVREIEVKPSRWLDMAINAGTAAIIVALAKLVFK